MKYDAAVPHASSRPSSFLTAKPLFVRFCLFGGFFRPGPLFPNKHSNISFLKQRLLLNGVSLCAEVIRLSQLFVSWTGHLSALGAFYDWRRWIGVGELVSFTVSGQEGKWQPKGHTVTCMWTLNPSTDRNNSIYLQEEEITFICHSYNTVKFDFCI